MGQITPPRFIPPFRPLPYRGKGEAGSGYRHFPFEPKYHETGEAGSGGSPYLLPFTGAKP